MKLNRIKDKKKKSVFRYGLGECVYQISGLYSFSFGQRAWDRRKDTFRLLASRWFWYYHYEGYICDIEILFLFEDLDGNIKLIWNKRFLISNSKPSTTPSQRTIKLRSITALNFSCTISWNILINFPHLSSSWGDLFKCSPQ